VWRCHSAACAPSGDTVLAGACMGTRGGAFIVSVRYLGGYICAAPAQERHVEPWGAGSIGAGGSHRVVAVRFGTKVTDRSHQWCARFPFSRYGCCRMCCMCGRTGPAIKIALSAGNGVSSPGQQQLFSSACTHCMLSSFRGYVSQHCSLLQILLDRLCTSMLQRSPARMMHAGMWQGLQNSAAIVALQR
jgi:hypothetical protein